MNSGNILSFILNGSILKEIEVALLDAFPNPVKLKRMLFYNDFNLNEFALGDDYTEIVFKVVQHFYSINSLAELIDKAREENDGNPKLQEVANKINAFTSLIKILIPLEKDCINQMKQAYFACYPENYDQDLEHPTETLKQILANLNDLPQGNAPESPIVQFVARFSQAEIPEDAANNLQKWGKQNANNFLALLTQIQNDRVSIKEQQKLPTYLIILLDTSKQHRNQRYFVSAWFIPDGRKDKFDFRTGKGYKFLEIQEQEEDTFKLKEIPSVVEEFIKQINHKYMTDYSDSPIIMFFLPFKLLNEPIDSWRIGKFPLGSLYDVVIRSCGRLKNYGFRGVWIDKWQIIQQKSSNTFISHDCQKLFSELKKIDTIGFKSVLPPEQKIIEYLDNTATPVAIWLRNGHKNINSQAELDALLECAIARLPQIVTQKRAETLDIVDREIHIGHHLALLWEDPYLLPTQIEYTTP